VPPEPDPRELLTSNLAIIDRVVAFACRRHRLDRTDCEDFASTVRLKLLENDYAVLRAYEGRSGFATFISIVIQRAALDFRIRMWGKWHPSAEAQRLGALAVDLERILHRDGRSIDEALSILAQSHEGVTREMLALIAARLPERPPKRRDVDVEEAADIAVTHANAVEAPLLAEERRRLSERVSDVMSTLLERVPEDERLILQLRFESGLTVAQIARSLRLDQKLTYRRIERRMREFREELARCGIEPDDVRDLIGGDEPLLRFPLGKSEPRPSMTVDERTPTDSGSAR